MWNTTNLPPGPRLPAPLQTAWALRDAEGFLRWCQRRHGDVFQVRFMGFPMFVYVTNPALARDVYATDRSVGLAGATRRDFLGPVLGDHSLLCLDGAEWLRHRKLLGPAFHRRRVDAYEAEMAAIAGRHLDDLPADGEVQLRPTMQAITLDVILRLVMGISERGRHQRLRELLPELVHGGTAFLLWGTPPRLLAALSGSRLARRVPHPLRRFLVVRDEVDALVYAEIAERRRDPGSGDDVLAQLIAERDEAGRPMSDQELRDEMITLLEAGHETTATGLSWAFERLVRNPRVLAELERDLEAGSERYLDAVVRETLRRRSVVLDTPRQLSEPLEIGGHHVPAGTYLSPVLPLVQSNPEAFDSPDEFRPERFLDGDGGREGWIPFGGGKRHCVGSHFALLEMRVIIRETLRRYELRAVDQADERIKPSHVTLVPGDLARVRLRRRTAQWPSAAAASGCPVSQHSPGEASGGTASGERSDPPHHPRTSVVP